ncbi:MAG: peptidylprolyl isomerase [Planctomycetes bacterium]|nr:peptidylprolyl isomerase [Planctomycetota bacterium]
MKRMTTLSILACLIASLGMSGESCDPGANLDLLINLRGEPAILASSPREDAGQRTFEVDLRSYPDAARVNWDFGDGGTMRDLTIARGKAVSHNYNDNGTFTVTVRLFSAPDIVKNEPARLLATGSLPVDVLGPNVEPIASFTFEDVPPSETTVGISKKFDGTRSRDPDGSIVEHRWDFGDGGQALGSTAEHGYAKAGLYTIRLSVKDNRGARTFTERTLFVNGVPESRFRFEVDDENPLLVRFSGARSNDPDGEIVRYYWDFGDGETSINGGRDVQHIYSAPGDYTVRLDVFDDQGVTDFVMSVVTVTSNDIALTSVSDRYGVIDTEDFAFDIDGFNFADGATARLERGGTQINASTVSFGGPNQLNAEFDLSGAALGDYNLIVTNPDTGTATLDDAIRVVTPNKVRLVTSLGEMVFELVDDAPVTTANFIQYVEDGFYDGTIFHRVVPNFVVQGGGFLPGMVQPDGLRDPIVNEFSPSRSNLRSTVAMAKVGGNPDSATSQFFVNLNDNSGNLDNQNGGFTVFANVIEGMSVADAIAAVELNGEEPVVDVILIRAERE